MTEQPLKHRSIRDFAAAPSAAQQAALETTAQETASSNYLQQFTLIKVTDTTKKQAIAELTHCPFVAGPGLLYVFVLDTHRNLQQVPAANAHNLTGWAAFLAGAADCQLAAQALVSEAEMQGLGTCYLGSILNDPRQMISRLKLPRHTFPLLGVMVGVPAGLSQPKPRLPHAVVVGDNQYPTWDTDALQDYDNTTRDYYRNRPVNARDSGFVDMLLAYTKTDLHQRDEIGRILKAQGFELPQ